MDKLISVLLVDDHAIVRAGIKQYLELNKQINVIGEADNGESAIKFFSKTIPDIVVSDIQMPIMNGIELTNWIKKYHRETGILILSAYDDDPYVQAVLQAGANGFVLKTSSPDEIVQAVIEVAEGKAVMDALITQRLIKNLHNSPHSDYETLSDREIEILQFTAKGFTNKGIGVHLGISDRTVQNHLANIFNKLHVASRTEAVMRGISLGLIPSTLPNESK